jgi:hypothetical protein
LLFIKFLLGIQGEYNEFKITFWLLNRNAKKVKVGSKTGHGLTSSIQNNSRFGTNLQIVFSHLQHLSLHNHYNFEET